MNRDRSTFVESLSQAARDNPLAAALIGGGALWLVFGNRLGDAFGSMASVARSGARGAAEATEAAMEAGRHTAEQATEAAQATLRSTGEAATSASAAVKERMNEASSRTTDAGRGAAGSFSSAAEALHPSSRTLSQLRKGYASAQSGLTDLFERQPLVLGALGLAIGAGVAGAIASTNVENEWAGSLSDEVKDTARNRAEHVAETAQRAAGEFGSDFRAAAGEAAHKIRKAGEDATHAMREKV